MIVNFDVMFVKVLEYKHPIIPFEVVEDDDDFSRLLVLICRHGIQFVHKFLSTVFAIDAMDVVFVFCGVTDENGLLNTLFVCGCFIVGEDE